MAPVDAPNPWSGERSKEPYGAKQQSLQSFHAMSATKSPRLEEMCVLLTHASVQYAANIDAWSLIEYKKQKASLRIPRSWCQLNLLAFRPRHQLLPVVQFTKPFFLSFTRNKLCMKQ
jgi:hypothetical protein